MQVVTHRWDCGRDGGDGRRLGSGERRLCNFAISSRVRNRNPMYYCLLHITHQTGGGVKLAKNAYLWSSAWPWRASGPGRHGSRSTLWSLFWGLRRAGLREIKDQQQIAGEDLSDYSACTGGK
jgi:hypothetical protein